ncbi:uncharacterized protein L203_106270 [Cryptococcus depauperatus CBS 7841]|uniref:Uncharacterized protein n=1 Tax=Cryptococcus depauperatus CBS 7841 TaxID=1295531 RepID=A0A1E3IJE0_9TREE|nr:hypothetical protein L203_02727 [Cryptococcus depauperatus CBS 7841]
MPSSFYNIKSHDDNLSTSGNVSPTDALFPPELSTPYGGQIFGLDSPANVEMDHLSRGSISSNDGSLSFLSPPNLTSNSSTSPRLSLSPMTGTVPLRPSSCTHASPSSHSASSSYTDDVYLQSSFSGVSSNELDMFLLPDENAASLEFLDCQNDQGDSQHSKPGSFLFLPNREGPGGGRSEFDGDAWIQNLFKNSNELESLSVDQINRQNRQQQQQRKPFEGPNQPDGFDIQRILSGLQTQIDAQAIIQEQFGQSQEQPQTIQPHLVKESYVGNRDSYLANSFDSAISSSTAHQPNPSLLQHKNSSSTRIAASKHTSASKLRSNPINPDAPAQPTVGKHNKTERRYRQKVQLAQSDLRDSVPYLRVLYGTSTSDQLATTDQRDADGKVDGLGDVTRPNASQKATILIGARMYIELLQKRNNKLLRMANELEAYRRAVDGEQRWNIWKQDFEKREAEIERIETERAAAKIDSEESDVDEPGEENEGPSKKRKRVAITSNAKKIKAPTKSRAATAGKVFAAFAMSFSFTPSASKILPSQAVVPIGSEQVFRPVTTRQILIKLPLVIAEHICRLLSRGLPSAISPSPSTLLDWTWRLFVAIILGLAMGPIITKWSKKEKEWNKPGSLRGAIQDLMEGQKHEKEWEQYAASVVGSVVNPSTLARWHTILHLTATAQTPYSLALLSLLQPQMPVLRSSTQTWTKAQFLVDGNTPPALASVLELSFPEAQHCLSSVSPTSTPLTALAEQVTLIHIHDLYIRFFVHLVETSIPSSLSSDSLRTLLLELENHNIRASLIRANFDKEIKCVLEGIPKGSVGHALGLVLIGLWGIFAGPAPSAQATLAAALAADQVSDSVHGLSSIPALLELLYPGSSFSGEMPSLSSNKLSPNTRNIDNLALSIIEYISLLLFSSKMNPEKDRASRKDESLSVQRKVVHLRSVLNKVNWVGLSSESSRFEDILEDEDENEEYGGDDSIRSCMDQEKGHLENEREKYERAKEKLVSVLSKIGRRAAGRARERDEDSGLGGDLDEL